MKQKIKMAIAVAVALFACIPTFSQKTVEEKKKEINAISACWGRTPREKDCLQHR